MSSEPPPEIDPRRVRMGLVILAATFLVALVLAIVVDDGFGRALMIGIMLVTFIRAALLARSIRRTG